MRGGVKVYRGAPRAARLYLEADRSRADEYYLRDGDGVARRFGVDAEGRVVEFAALSGDRYESWVAGLDPDTGEPRGRLRADGSGVRFVEVVVNGPKSWSLAAELHPDVAEAYEAAQDQAAQEIIGWLGRHATTRVGPRGGQVAVPVDRLEAVTVRHYTSRAGDPHRHLHLQVNARVFAAGKWRGLDTVAFRDSIAALNGIGHAAVVCDPGFRAALAGHGYNLNPDGEITQLAGFVGAFSKRAAQITGLLDRYEAEWRRAHPGVEPGPRLRRAWDARAWAEDRPDKHVPQSGEQVRQRWLDELAALGYRDHDQPTQLALQLSGAVDRDAAAGEVLARLGAARSAWNAADVRGQVELLLGRVGLVAEPAVRMELAEDISARTLDGCVSLHERPGVPEHVRALTSRQVLAVEADLTARFAARGAIPATAVEVALPDGSDDGQRAALRALAGDAPLVVIEGAAGAGKTTTLAATREALEQQGSRLVVVTPTLKAAQAAATETGARAGSAAWLAWQHGWRWDQTGEWTRVPCNPHPDARLDGGDLLLVDEAGMLDQDTAHALLAIADETGARLALLGDSQQLPAVGRGGTLALAHRWVHPEARVGLDTIHRFLHTVDGRSVPDLDYAQLSLAMRSGEDPGAVFDALHTRGHIALHESEVERTDSLADQVATAHAEGQAPLVVVDTREHAATLSAAIRERLVAAGAVDDQRVVVVGAGQRVGVGDVVVTRRNDHHLGVANRESWTVTGVHDQALTVTDADRGNRVLTADYMREHVELGYAVTGYGAQGDTSRQAHLLVTETTSAAAAYVAMTRGREANTAHLVADSVDDAREQWIAAFTRDRADLGPAAARAAAAHASAGYTTPRPLAQIVTDLHAAWDAHADARAVLDQLTPRLEHALTMHPIIAAQRDAQRDAEWQRDLAHDERERAQARLAELQQAIEHDAQRFAAELRAAWDSERAAAQADGCRIQQGAGKLGFGRREVRDATARLEAWAAAWQPVLGDLHQRFPGLVGYAAHHPSNDGVSQPLREYAHEQAVDARQSELDRRTAELAAAEQCAHAGSEQLYQLRERHAEQASRADRRTTDADITRMRGQVSDAQQQLHQAEHALAALRREPALTSQPDPNAWLQQQHETWRHHRDQAAADATRAAQLEAEHAAYPGHRWQPLGMDHGHSIGL